MKQRLTTQLLAGLALGVTAFAGDNDKKAVTPLTPLDDAWQFKLSMPGWIPWLEGDTGVNGAISHLDLEPDNIVPRIDLAADVRFEARKGRLSLLGEFLYMSLSDGMGTHDVVKKFDVQVDQTVGELGVAWRLIDSKRGYLDVVGGVRYTNFYQKLALQPNAERIDQTSTELVDAVSERLRTALDGSRLRKVIDQCLGASLAAIEGRDPTLPAAPQGKPIADAIRARVAAIVDARKAELSAALQARAMAATDALRARAQARVDGIKKDVSRRIARTLESKLDTTVSRTDDWWDPYIGLRGRYDLSEKFYLTGKGDIGGFGIGSDLTWTAEAAVGCQLTRNVFAEVGYRALGVNYDKDGLLMDTITHGPQVTLGINF